jgi:hypothetical protein
MEEGQQEGNGWTIWKNHVLETLKRLEKRNECLENKIDVKFSDLNNKLELFMQTTIEDVAKLQVRTGKSSAFYGTIGGVLTVLVALAIALIAK